MLASLNPALAELLPDCAGDTAVNEGLSPEIVTQAVNNGTMVLLANPNHAGVKPTLVGRPSRIKVNANIGTSPFNNSMDMENQKLQAAIKAGAHTVMDLSTAGDLDAIRKEMLQKCSLPIGTVPIYAAVQRYVNDDKDPAGMDPSEIIDEIAKQAEQGVDFMTIHAGVTHRAAALAHENRVLGIVSRGGSILARWMRTNNKENPLLTGFDDILDILEQFNVTISLGDGLRPGACADAGDTAQWEEVSMLAELTRRAWYAGVQVMIEGPGHVPMHLVQGQIQTMKQMCHGAPLYVLGPLVTDSAPGYDHISGAVGGTLAAYFGADFLCYVTPAEHLTLPCAQDVHDGVIASKIAAHSAEAALGVPAAIERDLNISKARKKLDWEAMTDFVLDPDIVTERRKDHKDQRECAMCGKFCAVRMTEETL